LPPNGVKCMHDTQRSAPSGVLRLCSAAILYGAVTESVSSVTVRRGM
jgi:hypothetical protein